MIHDNAPDQVTTEEAPLTPQPLDYPALLERIACAQEHTAKAIDALDTTLREMANYLGHVLQDMR